MYALPTLEQHSRAVYFDNTIEGLRKDLLDPTIHTALGHGAICLTDVLDRAYLPNVRDGVISPPKGTPTDAIAILPHAPQEKLWFSSQFSRLTFSQQAAARQQFKDLFDGTSTEKAEGAAWLLKAYLQSFEASRLSGQLIAVPDCSSDFAGVTDGLQVEFPLAKEDFSALLEDTTFRLYAIPLVFVIISGGDDTKRTVVHESIHVAQRLSRPLQEKNDKVWAKNELEAYHVSANYAPCVYDTTGQWKPLETRIENLRLQHADPEGDPFALNDALRAALGAAKLLKYILPPESLPPGG